MCGLRLENIKRRLLTEDNLNYEKAFQIAVAMEIAKEHAKIMSTDGVSSVNKIQKSKFNRNGSHLNQDKTSNTSGQSFHSSQIIQE